MRRPDFKHVSGSDVQRALFEFEPPSKSLLGSLGPRPGGTQNETKLVRACQPFVCQSSV